MCGTMIDEYWTWQFYGYHSDELSPCSMKKIVVRCDDCCQYRVGTMCNHGDLCLSCAHKGERVDVFCDNCGTMIECTARQISHWVHHFCNIKCRSEFQVGENAPRHTLLCDVVCDNCGENLRRVQSCVGIRNFCDVRCYEEFRTGVGKDMYALTSRKINADEAHSVYMTDFYSNPINREKSSAAHQGMLYSEWEGFACRKEYCPAFDDTCRESNRDKYDRRCFLCGLNESENITSTGKHRKLSVHHVDMDRAQGCNGIKWKLVPVCMHCHGGAHNDMVMDRIVYLLNNVWNMV